MGEQLKRIDPSKELFRVQKTDNHWEKVRRSKEFIADEFFPPRAIPLETNLQAIFAEESISAMSEDELEARLLDVVPHLNHDTLIELSLYLAFENKHNSKAVWRAIEAAGYESLHLLTLK